LSRILQIATRLLAVAIAGFVGWRFYIALFGIEATTQRTKELLFRTTFSRFEFRNATFHEAVEAYRRALNEGGIPPDSVRVRVMTVDTQEPSLQGPDQSEKQSLTLSNLPAYEAGLYVAGMFDLKLSVVGREARIHRREDTPLIRRTIRINRNFSPEALGLAQLNSDGVYDMRPFLKTHGVSVSDGGWATNHPGSSKLEVFLTQDEIDLVETMGGCVTAPLTWQDRLRAWFGL
jgi:hypothetical protein